LKLDTFGHTVPPQARLAPIRIADHPLRRFVARFSRDAS
jgi:hypothetical protein